MRVIDQKLAESKTRLVAPSLQPAGCSHPLGATVVQGGVNFSVYSQLATRVELLFFDREDDGRPSRVINIDPANRTYHYWHAFVPDVRPRQIYGLRRWAIRSRKWFPV